MTTQDKLIGATLGGCQIVELLGIGGMARVYRGHQQRLGRTVAVKVLPQHYSGESSFVVRFEQEAQVMAMLHHPNIIQIYDFGEQQDKIFFIMEYIAGGNLRERMLQPMKITEAARLFMDVVNALDYAHSQGVIHRDIKPVNVLLDPTLTPQQPRAVLTDFGIARLRAVGMKLTREGAGVGTPEYMSPEQCRGDGDIDQRADIYALGILLYELLCGHPPFMAEGYAAVAHAHIYEPPLPPAAINPAIGSAIQSVILRALRKDREERYATAREMGEALTAAINAGKSQRTASRSISIACSFCHQPNPAAMNFCSFCGGNLRGGPAAALPAALNLDLPPITCLACGASNLGVNRHCTRCGARLSTVICVNCGRIGTAGQRFCVACGETLQNR